MAHGSGSVFGFDVAALPPRIAGRPRGDFAEAVGILDGGPQFAAVSDGAVTFELLAFALRLPRVSARRAWARRRP